MCAMPLQTVTEGKTLVVPHPRWQERDFVKAPLADLFGAGGSSSSSSSSSSGGGSSGTQEGAARRYAGLAAAGPAGPSGSGASSDEEEGEAACGAGDRTPAGGGDGGLQRQLRLAARLWQEAGGERQLGTPHLECVLPMGRLGLWPWQRRTQVGRAALASLLACLGAPLPGGRGAAS